MLNCRTTFWSALSVLLIASAASADEPVPRVALITTVWYHNSHADMIGARLLESYTLDGKGGFPKLKLASLYTDQVPANDKSRKLSAQHGFPIYTTIEEALTLGGDKLAVDGVLLIAEHGNYPDSPTGSTQFPKRRFFEKIAAVFEKSGKSVPVFCDKHIADNWQDVEWFVSTAKRLNVPLMAGSSLPILWRKPEADVERDRPLKEIVVTSYHRLDAYGFHAMEAMQALAERRKGGETGILRVQCLEGDAVWKAADEGRFSMALLDQAATRFQFHPLPPGKKVREVVKHPILFLIEYRDGLKAAVVTLDGIHSDWAAAWSYADGGTSSTLFWTQEFRPFMHFAFLTQGIEQFVASGKSPWPVERTILTSGALDALLVSRQRGGAVLETPYLKMSYESDWKWKQPPPPPPDRPITEQ